MPSHPFFNAGAAPKRATHPLIEASQPGGWMERAGRIGTAIAGLPGAIAKGVYDEYANTAQVFKRIVDEAYNPTKFDSMDDSGRLYLNGKEVQGPPSIDEVIRASTNIADLAPVSAIGSGAARAAKGMKAVDPNTLHALIGPKGATKAERKLLEEAKDMTAELLKSGLDEKKVNELVQQKTGWGYNPGMNVWQMEVSDLPAKVTPLMIDDLASSKSGAGLPMRKLRDVYDHPELAKRYPEMFEQTDVWPLGPYSPGYNSMRGSADFSPPLHPNSPISPRIRVWGDPSVDVDAADNSIKSLMAHEVQHNIQHLEEWPQGSNPNMFFNEKLTAEKALKQADELAGPDGYNFPRDVEWMRNVYAPTRQKMDEIAAASDIPKAGRPREAANRTAMDLYRRTAGEAQARNVQRRLSQEAVDQDISNIMRGVDEATGRSASIPESDLYPPPFNPARQRSFESTQDVPYSNQHRLPPYMTDTTIPSMSASTPEHPFFTQPEPPINRFGKPDINKRGDYMGAPPGINSPEAERALVARIVDQVNSPTGKAGAGFYDNFSAQVARHTDDPEKARQLGYITAETSPTMSWNGNVNEGIKGFNQKQMGDPIRTGRYPTQTGELIEKNIDRAPWAMPPSDKTGPFGYNLLSKDFPMPGDPKRAVFDMHEGRSFGFPEPDHNFSPAEHRYGDRISQMVQDATGLDHKQWQEQDWAHIRTRDGLPMSKPQQQLFDESASFTQMEAIPGSTTGATTIRSMPDAAKQQYTDEMFDAAGGNELARMFGLSPELTPGYGKYEGVITPNRKIDVLTATKGSGKDKAIEASSDALMNNVRRMYQFVFGQNASYGTTYRPLTSSESAKSANMAYINLGKQMAGKEGNDTVMAALQRKLGDDWNAKVNPAPYRDGVLIGDISGMKPKEFQKLVGELNGELGGSGVELGRNVGFQMDDIDWSKGEWKQLLEGVRTNPRIRKIFDENVTTILERVQNKHEALGKSMGFDTNTMLDKVRNIAAKGGYGALMNAVKQGIIPAAAIGFILAVGVDEGVLGDRSS